MTSFTKQIDDFTARAKGCLHVDPRPVSKAGLSLKAAAVLVPIVEAEAGLNVLLTQRSHELPTHAGQVAFPGGKIDAGDASPLAAALRETFEETGIEQRYVRPVGYLDTFETGTGYTIVPVVGILERGFSLRPEPGEVSEIFEVPLSFLMDPDKHQAKQGTWRGVLHNYHAIPYKDYHIWGVTAAMLMDLYRRMSGHD